LQSNYRINYSTSFRLLLSPFLQITSQITNFLIYYFDQKGWNQSIPGALAEFKIYKTIFCAYLFEIRTFVLKHMSQGHKNGNIFLILQNKIPWQLRSGASDFENFGRFLPVSISTKINQHVQGRLPEISIYFYALQMPSYQLLIAFSLVILLYYNHSDALVDS